jgi:hypothetical protein
VFVLDEAFPQPILREAIQKRTLELDVRLLEDFAPSLAETETPDHRLIQSLWQRSAEGLITVDDAMLSRPEVVMMIEQTRFSVVTVRRLGHDGIAASGLFLVHVARIAQRHNSGQPQVWRLTAPERQPSHTRDLKRSIIRHGGEDPDRYKLTHEQLRRPL